MSKLIIFVLCILIFTLPNMGQKVIENSDMPSNTTAGKILQLTEVTRFTDESGDFFFQFPLNLMVSSSGSIFIQDDEQLYQFDSNGKYLRNYFKKGQGPGEMVSMSSYQLTKDNIIIHNNRPHKLLWFDYRGKLVEEIRIEQQIRFLSFLHYFNNKYYFTKSGLPSLSEGSGIKDVPYNILSISKDGEHIQELMNFPLKQYVAIQGGGRGSVSLNEFISVPFENKYLLISHTPEYLIKLYDIESNKVVLAFKREYKRRHPPPEIKKMGKGSLSIEGKKFVVPYPEFVNDIRCLLVYKDNLWVTTSTFEEEKGYLVDVYNLNGKYIDNFYLKLADKTDFRTLDYYKLAIWGDFLFYITRNEDELYEVIKYRIEYKEQ